MSKKDILKKIKAGRPTKYNDEILLKTYEYITDFHINNAYNEKKPYAFREAAPSIVGLANYIDIHRDTIYTWAKEEDKAQFSDIVKRIEQDREMILVNKSLFNEINSQITKLMLAQIGIIEKQVIEQTNIYDDMSEAELKKLAGED